MKVLITGGAGFIGCVVANLLIEKFGAEVVAFDNLLEQVHPTGRVPEAFPASARLFQHDVRDHAAWDELLSGFAPDFVVHFAAETGTGQSMHAAARHASVNVTGTAELLDALLRHERRPRRLLLSSSRAVYGEGAWIDSRGGKFYPGVRSHGQMARGQWDFLGSDGQPAKPLPHEAGAVEPHPTSVYGATKLAQEHLMAAWCAARDLPLSILRFQNVYGRGQSPTNPYTGIVNIFHQLAHRKETIPIYEDGHIGRDFVWIDDVAEACIAALMSEKPGAPCYDVGTGKVLTIAEIARAIALHHHAPQPVVCGKFREGDVRWAVASTKALERDLGVTAQVGFEQGVKAVGDWLFKA